MGANSKDAQNLPGLILARRRRRRLGLDPLVKGSANAAAPAVFSDLYFDAAVSGGNNQVVAVTLDGVAVAAAAQTLQHSQSVAATLGDVSVAVSQTAQHPQSVAFTLGDLSVAGTQAVQHPQSVAFTLGDVAVSVAQTNTGAGSNTYDQVVAFTLDSVAATATQTAQHPQSLAVTLDSVSVTAAQTAQHPQSLALTLDDVGIAISQGSLGSYDQVVAFALDGVDVNVQQVGPDVPGATIGMPGGGLTRMRRKQDEELIELVLAMIVEEVI